MTKNPRSIEKEALSYRPCVGIMLLNERGQVFVGRRVDGPQDAWQMPQGGIDPGENPKEAALRELVEEVGTNDIEFLGETDDWLIYDLPDHLVGHVWGGRYRGQRQKWFLARLTGPESGIDIDTDHPEFDAWRWLDLQDLPNVIVPFKRDVYETLVERFRALVAANGGR